MRCVGVIPHINIGGVRTNYAAFLILHGDPLSAGREWIQFPAAGLAS